MSNVFYNVRSSTGGIVAGWTPIALTINTTFYVQDWTVDFNKLVPGINHISVMAQDMAGNTTSYADTFYVKKDTALPQINVGPGLSGGDLAWRNTGGTLYDVDFSANGVTLLDAIQYCVYPGPGRTGTPVIGWTYIGGTPPLNVASYTADWGVNFNSLLEGSTNFVSVRCWNVTGTTVTLNDAFRVFKDISQPGIIDPVPGDDTVWRSSNAASYNLDFYDIPQDGSRLSYIQTRISSGPYQSGTIHQDWYSQLLNIGATYYNQDWQFLEASFLALKEGKNYVSARVFDYADNPYELSDVFFVLKDTTPPYPANNQGGDDIWRRENTGSYNVDIFDTPEIDGSKLSYFAVRASTASGSSGPWLGAWQDAVLSIAATHYTQNWQIPETVWNMMHPSTNYISIRALDTAGNVKEDFSLFYVLKDSIAPSVADNADESPVPWRKTNPGSYWNVDFEDWPSGLYTAQWTAYSEGGLSGTQSVQWTDIFTGLGQQLYDSDWNLGDSNWDLLPGGTSYVSVRVWDVAGSTYTGTDVFIVLKDTVGPTIVDNQAGYESWLNSGSGLAWNIDFTDDLSLLSTAQYIICVSTGLGGPITSWTAIFETLNAPSYEADFSFEAGHFGLLPEGTSYVTVRAYDRLSNSATSYDVFCVKKDTTPPSLTDGQADLIAGAPSDISSIDVDFYDTGHSLLDYFEYTVRPSSGLPPQYIINWTALASGINATYYVTNWSLESVFGTLSNNTSSYVSVRAFDHAGNSVTGADVLTIYKQALGPSIIPNFTGDNAWRNTLSGVLYDVDFLSNSGADLDRFEIKVCSGSGQPSDKIIADWFTVLSGLETVYYTDDWAVPESTFSAMSQGTNYVSIRAYDVTGVSTTVTDVFYVRKDTLGPYIEDLEADVTGYVASAGYYDVRFYDYGIGVTSAQYIVSTSSHDVFSTALTSWKQIFSGVPAASYTAPWTITNWENLIETSTNYVSVRSFDGLGQASTSYAVFLIHKDTTVPLVPFLYAPAENGLVSSVPFPFEWGASTDSTSGINGYYLQVSSVPDFGTLIFSTTTTATSISTTLASGRFWWRVRANDNTANYSQFSASRTFLIDISAPVISDNQAGYEPWLTSDPGAVWNVDFTDIGSGITTAQYRITSQPDGAGTVIVDWRDIFTSASGTTGYFSDWEIQFSSCTEGYNYVSARCFDKVGLSATTTDVFYVKKDTSAPFVLFNGEESGDLAWRNAPKSGGYNVDFKDHSSGLKDAYYTVYTEQNMGGNMKVNWSPIFTNISTQAFTSNWNISFASLQEGGTNYVTVRLIDTLLQMSTHYDLFFVRKDVSKPTIQDNIGAGQDSVWRKTDPGSIYGVHFYDLPSDGGGLSHVQTKVMKGALLSGTTVWDWTGTILSINATYYEQDWGLSFSSLQEGINYVSVRPYDNASNFDELDDVFFVKKDTTLPLINSNQTGDDEWRSSNSGLYNVDFEDAASGSGISGFDVRATTDEAGAVFLGDWTQVVSTNTYSYTAEWALPSSVWNSLVSGTTNYIWVRTSDFAFNISTSTTYLFYVKKDTSGVSITDGEAEGQDPVWRNTSRTFDVDFHAPGQAPLAGAQYTAHTAPSMAGAERISWRTVPGFSAGSSSFTDPWAIDSFDQLLDGATNWISVRCWNTASSTVTLNDVFIVKKDTTPADPPVLSSPLNNSATGQLNVYFGWGSANDLASGTSFYFVRVAKENTFSAYVAESSKPVTAVMLALPNESTYYWQIRVFDNASNSSDWSQTYAFCADTTAPPSPSLSQPLDELTTNYQNITFSWSTVIDSGPAGLENYLIELSTSQGFDTVRYSSTSAIPSITISAVTDSYYWRVFALDRAGNYSVPSTTRSIIIDIDGPPAPVHTSPLNGSATNQLSLSLNWDVSSDFPSGIQDYELLVSTSPDFGSVYASSTTALTSFATSYNEGIFYWKLRSRDNAGNFGVFSSSFSLIIDTSAPQTPSLTTPADDTRTNSTDITFSWSSSDDSGPAGTHKYILLISTDELFVQTHVSSTTALTSARIDPLIQYRYFWKVRSVDRAGNYSLYSSSYCVTTDTTVPVITVNQAGDDIWKADGSTTYDVDFFDIPEHNGSGLDYAQYIVYPSTSGAGEASGSPLTAWQDIIDYDKTNSTTYYELPWSLNSVFGQMQNGYNFVFTRVFDLAGNSASGEYFAFHVKKDTAAPQIASYQPAAPSWQNTSANVNVDFSDTGVGVKVSSFTAYTEPGFGGSQSSPWTTILDTTPPTSLYSDNWEPSFDLLLPGTNYISLRSEDGLANISGLADLFRILKDTVPPAGITDLNAATGSLSGEITLSWTAPADDALSDPVTRRVPSYLVKYSQTGFSSYEGFLSNGTTFYHPWQPAQPSVTETGRSLTGLDEGTTYYVGIVAIDKASNYGALSSTSSAWAARVAPAKVTTLSAQAGDFPGEIKLYWSAVGDDGHTGTASAYLLKYSTSNILSDSDFVKATTVQTSAPLSSGSNESAIIQSLAYGPTYYFAIKVRDEAYNYSVISNTVSAMPAPPGPAEGLIAYGEGAFANPRIRTWNGALWNAPENGLYASPNIRYTKIRSCNALRYQKLLGILSYDGTSTPDGNLYLQVWNGKDQYGNTISSWTDLGRMNSSQGSMYSAYRNFDIAYEQNSGRALVAYFDGSSGYVSYRVWSSTADAFVGSGNLKLGNLTGAAYWITLKPQPGSDVIMLGVLDANSDIFAAVWNGASGWISHSTRTVTTSAAIATEECFDIAWESLSGRAMILWGNGTASPYTRYDLWSSTAAAWLSASTDPSGFAGPNIGATANWISLAADPSSNRIGLSSVDGSTNWNLSVWDGSAWPSGSGTTATGQNNYEPTTATETNAARCADIAWEKDSGRCVAAGIVTASTLYFNWTTWTSGSGWTAYGTDNGYTWSDDVNYLELIPDPNTNNLLLMGIDIDGSLRTRNWTGTEWAGGNAITAQVSAWSANTNHPWRPAHITLDIYDKDIPTITNNQKTEQVYWRNNSGNYKVYFNDAGGSGLSQVRTAVYTAPSLGGSPLKNYEDLLPELSGINTNIYSSDWPFAGTTWNVLNRGQNNYITVRVYDGAGNFRTEYDAFQVWKDTELPSAVNNEPGADQQWLSASKAYDIDFQDQAAPLSNLHNAQYTAFTGSGMTGDVKIGWTNVPLSLYNNSSVNSPSWEISYDLLAHGTNYISLRVWDIAGSTRTYTDFFKILKDTQPPANLGSFAAAKGPFRGTIDLSWTAPGDDGILVTNTQGSYVIKYATYPIASDTLFNGASTYSSMKPFAAPQFAEYVTLTGLNADTTYYFAVRVLDKAGNTSPSLAYTSQGVKPRSENVFINEILASAGAGSDWVELYNNLPTTYSLEGMTLRYNQGTIGAPGTETTLWTGDPGLTISSGSFYTIPNLTLNSDLSHHVKLVDLLGRTLDAVQWPVHSSGNSLSRISDGNANFFEVDPTPTQGYANAITTEAVKINEVYYSASPQFIELYNNSSSTRTLSGWYLRNSNGISFVFSRKLYPYSFNGIGTSSSDDLSKTWTACFGTSGLSPLADYLVLENSAGQVVNRVTWRSSSYTNYLSYSAASIVYSLAATGNVSSPNTIGRYPSEGQDTDNNSLDFNVFSAASFGGRNNNPTPAASNTLSYPTAGSVMPRRSNLTISLGSDSSAGTNDTVLFVRTGGTADPKSPHVYRLSDLGVDLSGLSSQTTAHVFASENDIDGYGLADGAIYRIYLNSDNSSGAAPQSILDSVTYDATVHSSTASPSGVTFANEGVMIGILKCALSNLSPSGSNNIEFTRLDVRFTDSADTPLNSAQIQALFDDIYVFTDNPTYGTQGTYQSFIDTASVAHVSGEQIVLDANGTLSLNVTEPDASLATIIPQFSRTYFVAGLMAEDASSASPNTYKAKLTPGDDTFWREAASDAEQPSASGTEVISSTPTIIQPAPVPTDTIYPVDVASAGQNFRSTIQLSYAGDANFVGTPDNKLHAFNNDGSQRWQFTTGGEINSIWEAGLEETTWYTYVYAATDTGELYKLQDNVSYADNVWGGSMQLDSGISSNLAVYAYTGTPYLYVGTQNGRFYKIVGNGTHYPGWNSNPGIDGAPYGTPVIDEVSQMNENGIWFGTLNGSFYRINNGDNGSITASTTTASAIRTSPFILAGYNNSTRNTHDIYFGDDSGFFRCRTGSNLTSKPSSWNDFNAGAPIRSSPFYEYSDNSVYFGADNGYFYKIDATSGTLIWSFKTGGAVRSAPVTGYNNDVYIGSDDGLLYGLSSVDGTMLPNFPIVTGGEIRSNIIYDGGYPAYGGWPAHHDGEDYIYFTSNDGRLHCIKVWP
ncbi:MAG: lamin tail domain-containing protein [Endomicrobiales bacterium]|nr:lamin tail domain-containing protein [Endomicrobiales bacterium]